MSVMENETSKEIDELFARIRIQLLKIRQTDPEIVEELKSLLSQLEDSVESVVMDLMKIKHRNEIGGKNMDGE